MRTMGEECRLHSPRHRERVLQARKGESGRTSTTRMRYERIIDGK